MQKQTKRETHPPIENSKTVHDTPAVIGPHGQACTVSTNQATGL